MKNLTMNQLEVIQGGVDCATLGGASLGIAIGLGAAAVLTGGIGLGVAAGLTAYFGGTATILCGMG